MADALPNVPIPDPPAGDGLCGSIIICERAYRAESQWVIAGTFNLVSAALQYHEGTKKLPMLPLSLWIRILHPGRFPDDLAADVFIRTTTWNGNPDGRCVHVAHSDIQADQQASIHNAELVVRMAQGGFDLTPNRVINPGKNVVRAHYELWADGRFLAFQPLEFTYTLEKVSPDDATASAGR
ncbi:MAG TPA: hypothetical protein VEL07_19815 [Planctomycetota bacterium]|nr:hypothetical protein [Planctomycetota bacterium]